MTEFVLNEFLPYQLSVLSARISREFSTLYREKFGLSIAEWRVVAHLSQTAQAVSIREVHQRVDMDKSKVSRAATRLQERGIVIKEENTSDRRLIALRLSQAGRDLIAELAPLAHQFERDYMEKLGTDASGFRARIDLLLAENDKPKS